MDGSAELPVTSVAYGPLVIIANVTVVATGLYPCNGTFTVRITE